MDFLLVFLDMLCFTTLNYLTHPINLGVLVLFCFVKIVLLLSYMFRGYE